MQGAGKFRSAAYGLYASKKFFTQRSITSHLVAVLWRPSGMASSSISWDEIWILEVPICFQYATTRMCKLRERNNWKVKFGFFHGLVER